MILSSPHTPFNARERTHQNACYRSLKACQKHSSSSPAHHQTFLLRNEQQTASFHSASEMRAACSLTRCTTESFAEAAKLLLKTLKNCSIRILVIFVLVNDQVCVPVLARVVLWLANGLPHKENKTYKSHRAFGLNLSLQQHDELRGCRFCSFFGNCSN